MKKNLMSMAILGLTLLLASCGGGSTTEFEGQTFHNDGLLGPIPYYAAATLAKYENHYDQGDITSRNELNDAVKEEMRAELGEDYMDNVEKTIQDLKATDTISVENRSDAKWEKARIVDMFYLEGGDAEVSFKATIRFSSMTRPKYTNLAYVLLDGDGEPLWVGKVNNGEIAIWPNTIASRYTSQGYKHINVAPSMAFLALVSQTKKVAIINWGDIETYQTAIKDRLMKMAPEEDVNEWIEKRLVNALLDIYYMR